MSNLVHVVVNDPHFKIPSGHVIAEPRELAAAQMRGVTTLPVDDDLCPPNAASGLDGFYIKQWGRGWLINKGAGERCCPMVLRAHPQRTFIYWCARLSPIPGTHATGRVRLTGDSSQAGYLSAGLAQLIVPDLIENMPMDGGGWTLSGVSSINVVTEGLLAMSLHAVARNVRILWSAVSLASHNASN